MIDNTQSLFVVANTPNGPRIIKIVDSDKINMDRYHWTKEYLEESYEPSGNAEYEGYQASFPRYELKNG